MVCPGRRFSTAPLFSGLTATKILSFLAVACTRVRVILGFVQASVGIWFLGLVCTNPQASRSISETWGFLIDGGVGDGDGSAG